MGKIHYCKENIYDDVSIIFDKINSGETAWICKQAWLAQKIDVDEGEVENIGDVIGMHQFTINFCPFCGEKLIDL